MSVTVNNVLYTRIDSTNTARVGDGSGTYPNGVSSSYSGLINIRPLVSIDSITCTVIEIGQYALNGCSLVTDIILPNTITTLKFACIGNAPLLKRLVIPESVTKVETFFIADEPLEEIYFCGNKEPAMINYNGDNYISAQFTGSVVVPSDYDSSKTTFCKRNIKRQNVEYCTIIKKFGNGTINKSVYLKWCAFSAAVTTTKI